MTTPTSTQDAPTPLRTDATPPAPCTAFGDTPDLELLQACLDRFVCVLYELDLAAIVTQHQPVRWEVGAELTASGSPLMQRLGLIYLCDALLGTPDISRYLFNRLRDALMTLDPALEQLAPPLDVDELPYVQWKTTPAT